MTKIEGKTTFYEYKYYASKSGAQRALTQLKDYGGKGKVTEHKILRGPNAGKLEWILWVGIPKKRVKKK